MTFRPFLTCLLVAPALLCGCFRPQPPVHFYVLASPPEWSVPATGPEGRTMRVVGRPALADSPLASGSGVSALPGEAGVDPRLGPRVGILPVTLPGYLQRPQMVVRNGDSVDIRMEDYHRWGEDLGQGIARVLSVAMTNSLAGEEGVAFPLRTGAPVDLRVQVDVRRFEGRPEGPVFLEALWSIRKDGTTVREGHFFDRAEAGAGMAAMVEAQSGLLVRLGDELAAGVRAVSAERTRRGQAGR